MSWKNNETSIIKRINEKYKLDLNVDTEDYNSSDATNKNYIVEIKERNFDSNHKFALEGLFLEKIKYEKLLSKKTKLQSILYINYFTDNVIAIWNLSKMNNFDWYSGYMKSRTFGSNNMQVPKLVCKLQLADAVYLGNLD